MSTVLEQVMKNTTPLPEEVTPEAVALLKEKRDRLLPVEEHVRGQLDSAIATAQITLACPSARRLDLDVLKWRHSRMYEQRIYIMRVSLPKLALISIKSPTFFIKRGPHRSSDGTSNIPSCAISAYRDITKQLDRATFGSVRTLKYTWAGIIPESARETISAMSEKFGEAQVYLLSEAPAKDWTINSEPAPRPIDPLIVVEYEAQLFVVGSFDPTPFEQYVASEFTT